ncbi:D-alanyl-D-alanine carboxypeptidase/D-alanyl-D-alanine endopeptidase [Ferrimonas gelatinilytica]|uniref:Serine-type D-Ala-D-Ala carboxypeptidase n=1 Tax=Ferrimonas gelatinilytica TaxID=1255257 RepID=A0ABP9RVS7_9GAMM
MRILAIVLILLSLNRAYADYADFKTLLPLGSQMALLITDTDGNPLYEFNADRQMIPASTLKLVTATAAWLELGESFRFVTEFRGPRPVMDQLPGDLVLMMRGDPTLRRADLSYMVQTLAREGVRQINGDLILDGHLFDGYDRAPGWPWDDLGICYASPASAVMLDKNCATVAIRKRANRLSLQKPAHLPISVEQELRLAPTSSLCPLEMDRKPENHYTLRGCLNEPTTLAIAVTDPHHYVTEILYQQLSAAGIRLHGEIRVGEGQPGQPVLAQHQSAPLSTLLRRVLEDSDNALSEALLRTIAHSFHHQGGSFPGGIVAVKQILRKQLGIDLSNSDLFDGSGLSRYNLISARQLAQVLMAWQQDPRLAELRNLLPIAGESGTLKWRSGLKPISGKLAAKSGSFKQVRNLAGYLQREGDSPLIVIQLINGLVGDQKTIAMELSQFEQNLYRCITEDCMSSLNQAQTQ